jgi:hypothetical protein
MMLKLFLDIFKVGSISNDIKKTTESQSIWGKSRFATRVCNDFDFFQFLSMKKVRIVLIERYLINSDTFQPFDSFGPLLRYIQDAFLVLASLLINIPRPWHLHRIDTADPVEA